MDTKHIMVVTLITPKALGKTRRQRISKATNHAKALVYNIKIHVEGLRTHIKARKKQIH